MSRRDRLPRSIGQAPPLSIIIIIIICCRYFNNMWRRDRLPRSSGQAPPLALLISFDITLLRDVEAEF